MNTLLFALSAYIPGMKWLVVLPALAELRPLVNIGSSGLLSWLITLLMLCVAVSVIVWLVSKFAGPPNIPEPFRWIIWVVVAIALLVMILAAFGVRL